MRFRPLAEIIMTGVGLVNWGKTIQALLGSTSSFDLNPLHIAYGVFSSRVGPTRFPKSQLFGGRTKRSRSEAPEVKGLEEKMQVYPYANSAAIIWTLSLLLPPIPLTCFVEDKQTAPSDTSFLLIGRLAPSHEPLCTASAALEGSTQLVAAIIILSQAQRRPARGSSTKTNFFSVHLTHAHS